MKGQTGVLNGLVFAFLCAVYHGYDVLCFIVANTLPLWLALLVLFFVIVAFATTFLLMHDVLLKRGWDILWLDELHRGSERSGFLGWLLKRGCVVIYVVGPITVGPHIVSILLSGKGFDVRKLLFFIVPGSLLSVLFWVLTFKGVWGICVRLFENL